MILEFKLFKNKYLVYILSKIGGIYKFENSLKISPGIKTFNYGGNKYPINFDNVGFQYGREYIYLFELGKGQIILPGVDVSPLDLSVFDDICNLHLMRDFVKEEKKEFKWKELVFVLVGFGFGILPFIFKIFGIGG